MSISETYILNVRHKHVPAYKEHGEFYTFDGYHVPKSEILGLDRVTPDQAEFELVYRKYKARVDLMKSDNLMYLSGDTTATYQIWRVAKGLTASDPNYLQINQPARSPYKEPEVYTSSRYKGD